MAQAAADAALAQSAVDMAKTDADAAATAAASAAPDATALALKAANSCAEAATRAATAVQSAIAAEAKLALAKTEATAMASAAGLAKTEASTLADKVDAVRKKVTEADLSAGVAKSANAVTAPIAETSKSTDTAKKATDAAKADTATADTSSTKCKDDATTAQTAAALAKTLADAVKTAADLAKASAEAGNWDAARLAAETAATQAANAKNAADQAKTDAGTLKASTDTAKPQVEKAKDDADKAKTDVEAIEATAQTADTEAENDRLGRVGAGNSAAAQVDPDVLVATGGRARAYLSAMLGSAGMGKAANGKLYTNCPATAGGVDYGGIRPDPLDTYYKAAFGLDKPGSVKPWLAIDDAVNKSVCSVVHDDLGQAEDKVYAPYLGKAGIYLNPSRIAGDGYRFRAQVSFKALPDGASHPNREALLGRYVRPPAAHTAGLRLWRKATMRGYVRWMKNDVAGWDAVSQEMAAYYAAAHVHFWYEGPSSTAPQQFKPVGAAASDLITVAEYKKCVDDKLKAGGEYAGKSATYTDGFVWPYLHLPRWGTKPRAMKLADFVQWLYGKIEETSWDMFSNELIHKLIEGAEKKNGELRGHVIAEFHSSPPLIAMEYTCTVNASHQISEIANKPGGASTTTVAGVDVTYTQRTNGASNCHVGGCAGKFNYSGWQAIDGGIPLCAIGRSLGGCWLFTPRDSATWAHEVGHHRHMEHAQAYDGETTISPGGQLTQHDSRANAYQAAAPSTFQRAWDRWCIMSYDSGGPHSFCGKCLLKNRGWRITSLVDPAAEVQDA